MTIDKRHDVPPVWSVAPLHPQVTSPEHLLSLADILESGGKGAVATRPRRERRRSRHVLARYGGAAAVAIGGLGCAAAGAVLGGVGSAAPISPAAVHSFLTPTSLGGGSGLPALPGGAPGLPSTPSGIPALAGLPAFGNLSGFSGLPGLPGFPSPGGSFSLLGTVTGSGGSVAAQGSGGGVTAGGGGSVAAQAPTTTTTPGLGGGGGGSGGSGTSGSTGAVLSLSTVTSKLPIPSGGTPSLSTVTGKLPGAGSTPSLSTLRKQLSSLPTASSGGTCVQTPGASGSSSAPVTGTGTLRVTSPLGSVSVAASPSGVKVCGG